MRIVVFVGIHAIPTVREANLRDSTDDYFLQHLQAGETYLWPDRLAFEISGDVRQSLCVQYQPVGICPSEFWEEWTHYRSPVRNTES